MSDVDLVALTKRIQKIEDIQAIKDLKVVYASAAKSMLGRHRSPQIKRRISPSLVRYATYDPTQWHVPLNRTRVFRFLYLDSYPETETLIHHPSRAVWLVLIEAVIIVETICPVPRVT